MNIPGFRLTTALVVFMIVFSSNAQTKTNQKRSKININTDWIYFENSTKLINDLLGEKGKQIDLPHTWNYEDVVDAEPGYRRSASWYKKDLEIDIVDKKTNYELYFEGANINTKVYVNGKEAGKHIGGYVGFTINVTKYVKKGTNEVFVRVDNAYDPEIIPSQKSDFFIYGGITRDVWLLTTPKTHINSLKLSTPLVSEEKASLKIKVDIENVKKISKLNLLAEIFNPSNDKVLSKIISIDNKEVEINFENINNPELWDVKNPNLYKVKVSLISKKETIDTFSDRVGFRWFEFKDHGPFYLNGKRLLLRGTHRHEEHAGVGAAMTNEQHRNDMESIKEMGANFVRLAHYPQDPEVYKACDELGILVWDEIPWCRGGVGNEVWKTNTKNQLKEMIAQNYNHPSIIIWSLGNEMYWLPDFENGDDKTKMMTFLSELNNLSHELDPSRKTAIRKYYEGAEIVDVFSPSIWSGWYSGSYKSYQKAIDTYKPKYKHFLHAEYGGSSHVGRHTENPITGEGKINSDGWEEAIVQTKVANIAQIGDWSENYIVDLFDWHLRISETDSMFVGNIQWAFKDFGTPLRPENAIPYMNQKGMVDRNGNPKDAYYVFKSYWAEKPFVYIESHSWTERQGPKDKPRTISVYSNCESVELFHNDVSLGVKKKNISKFPASGLTWNVDFESGTNKLKAVGIPNTGKKVIDDLSINYRYLKNGSAKALKLSYKKIANNSYLVTATAIDSKGLRCLDYENKVYFQCLEGGKLLKNQGTPTGSSIIEMANGQASIEVSSKEKDSVLKVMVLNQNFKGTYLNINLK
ncbi:glycoside hydrolase family 2 protein [Bacteroidota bacterium]